MQYELESISNLNLFLDVEIPIFDVSQRLRDDLEEAKQYPIYTEKAKSELIIMPVLKELKRKNKEISLFSGFALNIDNEPDLNGSPDFILGAKPNAIEVEAPIFCLMESKNKAPDEGFAQCAAEMYASRLFNRQMNEPFETVYGAVTNGFDWIFMKLEENIVYIDSERYYINDVERLLGIMQWIVNEALAKK
jgi:hypothetical protein